ncbi:DUF3795 domain-containing protein [Chloroflexota bacterium]
MNREKELTSPCGLYCGICPLYMAQDNKELTEIIAARLGVPVEAARCAGCRAEKGKIVVQGKKACETFSCVTSKGLEFCYQCDGFPCPKLAPCADRAAEIPHNTKIYNLLLIQKRGVEYLVSEGEKLRRQYFKGKKVRAGGEPQLE